MISFFQNKWNVALEDDNWPKIKKNLNAKRFTLYA